MSVDTTNPFVVDAQSEIDTIEPPLMVYKFDPQGHVRWDKVLFGGNIYEPPTHRAGRGAADLLLIELEQKKLRPLNGHFAFWLIEHQDQIPEEWKQWEMLFMGAIITHMSFVYAGTDPELTCVKLSFTDGKWKLEAVNFSAHPMKPNYRIPLLPQ